MNVLLVEPAYRSKFPPLGLMKIATYHKFKGDDVTFVRGKVPKTKNTSWDYVYITSLFTYHWNTTIDTINYYSKFNSNVWVGGILASLMPKKIEESTGIVPHVGPLYQSDIGLTLETTTFHNQYSHLFSNIGIGIDGLPIDYSLFENLDVPYSKELSSSYFLRSTRGCKRQCSFCAVPILETKLIDRIPLEPYVHYTDSMFGARSKLILLDDNVLQSRLFFNIIDEIKDIGFQAGASLGRKRRIVDFNQGLDLRLLTQRNIKKLSEITLKPLRIALDSCDYINMFRNAVKMAKDVGITEISTYLLYNDLDSPCDLYNRIRIACDLNDSLNTRIYSFPMKYIPCSETNRKHIGKNWTYRQNRSIQCILNATKGIGPRNTEYFEKAFGINVQEFLEILQMPEDYIINRYNSSYSDRILAWKKSYRSFSSYELDMLENAVRYGKRKVNFNVADGRVKDFLAHYLTE